MLNVYLTIIVAGLLGGFISNAFIGFILTRAFVHRVLNPDKHTTHYREASTGIRLPIAIGGLITLTIIHAWLFYILCGSLPGSTWLPKGLAWGFVIWLMYWVFQEWFSFRMLFGLPALHSLFRLVVFLLAAFIEGMIIAFLMHLFVNLY
jgi:hypothetical protein